MLGKTALILAPIIVGAALLFLAFLGGRLFERVRAEHRASYILPGLHSDLVELVRRILSPTTDLDHVVVLPPAVKERAVELLGRADANLARVHRDERRQAGYR